MTLLIREYLRRSHAYPETKPHDALNSVKLSRGNDNSGNPSLRVGARKSGRSFKEVVLISKSDSESTNLREITVCPD
jgi:hypothetical protein